MARVGRNQPCPCGSGKKAKRCCGVPRGPSEEQLARAFLHSQANQGVAEIAGCDHEELEGLLDEMLDLPDQSLALTAPLPAILTPPLERLARAVAADDEDEVEAALEVALPAYDTRVTRVRLAKAVIAERDAGRIDKRVATVALWNLASDSVALVRSALLHAVAIASGTTETPSGILVARR
jgi:hypothetical protein